MESSVDVCSVSEEVSAVSWTARCSLLLTHRRSALSILVFSRWRRLFTDKRCLRSRHFTQPRRSTNPSSGPIMVFQQLNLTTSVLMTVIVIIFSRFLVSGSNIIWIFQCHHISVIVSEVCGGYWMYYIDEIDVSAFLTHSSLYRTFET